MPYRLHLNVTLACLAAPLLALADITASAADIELVLVGPKHGDVHGDVHAALMPITEQQWDATPVQTLRAAEHLRFRDVPPGDYAVQLFVDANGNGILDRSPRGLPREAVGFSNNPSLLMGAPDIQAGRFQHTGEALTLTIRLRQSSRGGGRDRSETTR